MTTATTGQLPQCDAKHECHAEVAYIDDRGFAYCKDCGPSFQGTIWRRCRKLRPHELNRLRRGQTIERY